MPPTSCPPQVRAKASGIGIEKGRDGIRSYLRQKSLYRDLSGQLEGLAGYCDTHDTSPEMEDGGWVEPQPMGTTSLRLPAEVIEQSKRQARAQHIRYTSYARAILEQPTRGDQQPELVHITERLDRIECAVTGEQS